MTPASFSSRNGPGGPRTVVHLNVADFAVCVERLTDPRLKGRPVIVAPNAGPRAVVYDMSEEAYGAGVRKGMALYGARRRCPEAVVVPSHPDRYEQAMRALVREVLDYSPLIEPGEADGHLFVDVTGTGKLFGPAVDVAWRMYRRVKRHAGLTAVWSVAPNKCVSKVATRLVKPEGEYIVAEGEEAAFLAPLPLWLIPGIEKEDLVRLRELNLSAAQEVAAFTPEQLSVVLGGRARFVLDAVRGIDPSPVAAVGEKPQVISADHLFGEDTNTATALEAALYRLVEAVGAELRRRGKAAALLSVHVHHTDGVRRIRQGSVRPPSATDCRLFETARSILHTAWSRRVRIRRIRLVCARMVFPPPQMALFPDAEAPRQEALMAAVDRVRERFGQSLLQVGRAMAL